MRMLKKAVLLLITISLMLTMGCTKGEYTTVPVLTTFEISAITQTSAQGGGTIVSKGGATIATRGVCWSTSKNPTIDDDRTKDGSFEGSWTSVITNLTPNTLYYVRAYATNSVGSGYGNQISFTTASAGGIIPTVATIGVSAITTISATGGGNVTGQGTTAVTARGVCWSTSTAPLVTGAHTTDGTGTGIFTSQLTGLSAGTVYYVRAYATNNAGTAYGTEVSFTTTTGELAPVVTTADITAIKADSALGGGNVTNQGSSAVTARGVCWSTSPTPVVSGSHSSNGSGTGTFTSQLSGLSSNTTYYVRAYATNSAGTGYGSEVSFTTSSGGLLPTVKTSDIYNINSSSATGGGKVTDKGGSEVTVRGICWSTSPSPTLANQHTADGAGEGTFTSMLTGLTPITFYYVRAYATNSSGTAYGEQVSFTTTVKK